MCSIALTYPARSHFQCTLNRERQDKDYDERCRSSGKGEDSQKKGRRRQADFNEAACYPSAVVEGAARRKMVCVRGVPGITGTLGKANSHFNPTQTGREPHHHVEAAVD